MAKSNGDDWAVWAENATSTQEFGSTAKTAEEFSKKYLLPYFSYTKTEIIGFNFRIYLADGSFFNVNKGNCIDFDFDYNGTKKPNETGRDSFRFLYCPYSETYYNALGKVGPHQRQNWHTRQVIFDSCKSAPINCSALLMIDGWEFKDDYPYKI